jgi:tetratricopeptide (TPR) repeat protein
VVTAKSHCVLAPYKEFLDSMSSTDTAQQDTWREQGNQKFASKLYVEAIELYSRSIECRPTVPALANRALAYLKMGEAEACIEDSTTALEMDSNHVKSYLRRATAKKELRMLDAAIHDFENVVKREPHNAEAVRGRNSCLQGLLRDNGGRGSHGDQNMLPYKEIVLHVAGFDDSAREVDSVAAINTVASSQRAPGAPSCIYTTGVEFERAWRRCKGDPDKHSRILLHHIEDPEKLPDILKQCLTPQMLFEISYATLSRVFKEDCIYGLRLMERLPDTDRFSLNALSLSLSQKRVLNMEWDAVLALDPDISEDDLRKLAGEFQRLRPSFMAE